MQRDFFVYPVEKDKTGNGRNKQNKGFLHHSPPGPWRKNTRLSKQKKHIKETLQNEIAEANQGNLISRFFDWTVLGKKLYQAED